MDQRLRNLSVEAKKKMPVFKQLIKKLKKKPPKNFDYIMQEIHEEVFAYTDCLSCANCCKTTSPIITEKDIERISKHLKIKTGIFIDKYLKKDTDGLWMFKQTPCVFLDKDNYCLIYDVRPKACREYPHLDRKKNIQLLHLHTKNATICPAVFDALNKLTEKTGYKK
jgi:Fe-S-cluster containining protein